MYLYRSSSTTPSSASSASLDSRECARASISSLQPLSSTVWSLRLCLKSPSLFFLSFRTVARFLPSSISYLNRSKAVDLSTEPVAARPRAGDRSAWTPAPKGSSAGSARSSWFSIEAMGVPALRSGFASDGALPTWNPLGLSDSPTAAAAPSPSPTEAPWSAPWSSSSAWPAAPPTPALFSLASRSRSAPWCLASTSVLSSSAQFLHWLNSSRM
mmetsp:Transcript_4228/g.12787  ORF Transcript_4228/g.12787 Transcript_4228/m.12787 type:complete len:214 (+) Transcript_4228:487-1128(+)